MKTINTPVENRETRLDCPLCGHKSTPFCRGRIGLYHDCPACRGIFLDPTFLPTASSEKERYQTHNNDVTDLRYQQFVSPLVRRVIRHQYAGQKGLDFGCGNGPVVSFLLRQKGYRLNLYDPFFHNEKGVLRDFYDFIICSEVIEHFHHPAREFARLAKMLVPNGRLYCLTCLFDDKTDFATWYYKDDHTHVFFYRQESCLFIRDKFGFQDLTVSGRLLVWQKKASAAGNALTGP